MQFLCYLIGLIFFISTVQLCSSNLERDCENLRARCEICTRAIHEGPNEDNIFGRLNQICREKVGRVWVWRDVNRCEMASIRCKRLNQKLTCDAIAEVARMQRRLP